jgi:hypothetical protein
VSFGFVLVRVRVDPPLSVKSSNLLLSDERWYLTPKMLELIEQQMNQLTGMTGMANKN